MGVEEGSVSSMNRQEVQEARIQQARQSWAHGWCRLLA